MSIKYQPFPQLFYTQISKWDQAALQVIKSETSAFWSSILGKYILTPTSLSHTSKYALLLALYLIQLDEVGRRVCSCLPVPLCHNQTEAATIKIGDSLMITQTVQPEHYGKVFYTTKLILKPTTKPSPTKQPPLPQSHSVHLQKLLRLYVEEWILSPIHQELTKSWKPLLKINLFIWSKLRIFNRLSTWTLSSLLPHPYLLLWH